MATNARGLENFIVLANIYYNFRICDLAHHDGDFERFFITYSAALLFSSHNAHTLKRTIATAMKYNGP